MTIEYKEIDEMTTNQGVTTKGEKLEGILYT